MNKKILTLLTAVLACLTSCGQTDDGIHRYNTKDFTLSKQLFVDTIPIEFIGNQIYIPVYIQGQRHLFNLDTGSSQGIAYRGTDIRLSTPLGGINARDANGRIDTIPVVEYPEFRLGTAHGIAVSGYKATLLTRPKRQYVYDGIIGFDLFNKGIQAKIDVKRKRLILTDIKNYFDQEPGFEIKYRLQRWTPYIAVNTFLDHEEQVLFDLGATDFFTMNKGHFDSERMKDPRIPGMIDETTYGQTVQGSYGAEKKDLIFYITFPNLPWGNFTFRNVHGKTTQGDSKIGGAILNYGTLVINPKKKRMKFWSYTGGNSVEVDNKVSDVTFMERDGRIVVATIRHHSIYYIEGFREGDELLAIDGKPIDSPQSAERFVEEKSLKRVYRLYDHRGFTKEIVIKKETADEKQP